jgi:xanthine/CO dehydrogenase XdhC/CoxF family maturation factor
MKNHMLATVINVKGSSSGKVGDKAIFDEKVIELWICWWGLY